MVDKLAYFAAAIALLQGLRLDCDEMILLGLAVLAQGISRWYAKGERDDHHSVRSFRQSDRNS